MDRLLSEQEICKICGSECEGTIAENCDWRDDPHGECHKLLAAQLAKTDNDWAAWYEKLCTGDVYGGMTILHKHWIERKRSIGL